MLHKSTRPFAYLCGTSAVKSLRLKSTDNRKIQQSLIQKKRAISLALPDKSEKYQQICPIKVFIFLYSYCFILVSDW